MYCDIDDVKHELGEIGQFLTGTSKPSDADVTSKTIPAIAGEIDGVLSARGLTVPVTEPASFLDTLSGLNALGAAARAAAALMPNRNRSDGTPFHEWLQKLYEAGLERLRSGEGVPDDAGLSSSGGMGRSFATSHPEYFAVDHEGAAGNQTDPVFRRDTQW